MNQYMENQINNEAGEIDLVELCKDMVKGAKKLWWLLTAVLVLCLLAAGLRSTTFYQPSYTASATMAVSVKGSNYNYVKIESAQQMAKVFPYIFSTGVLQNIVSEELGLEKMPGEIAVTADEGINLFTISVTSDNAQQSYDILQSVIENYPKVVRFVLGETTLEIMDETGVPEDTGKIQVIRTSMKKSILIGAVLDLLILIVYGLTRKTVRSRRELRGILNLKDYGSIPYVAHKKRRRKDYRFYVNLLNERIPQAYLESVRSLRIRVLREMGEKNYKTLMITSSVPGEGKTTLAVNLAIAIAKQGKKVLLVDTDLRNPSVAGQLNLQTEEAAEFGDVLKGKAELSDALMDVKVSRGELLVLGGAGANAEASKLLGTPAMKRLINELKEQADIVILDTPPSELLADAPALAKYVEAALYVVKDDYVKLREIRSGVQSLAMSGIDILGYLFNADHSGIGKGYGYGYGYGYRYLKANYHSLYRRSGYASYTGEGDHRKNDPDGRVIKE